MVGIVLTLVAILLFLGLVWIAENNLGMAGIIAHVILRVALWLVVLVIFIVAVAAIYYAVVIQS